jgi:hypothetical protein
MSIFGSILGAVFGTKPAEAAPATTTAPAAGASAADVLAAAPATVPADVAAAVNIPATLDALVAKSGEHLDWRMSIVDLMKALGLDSSLAHRKELATELHYAGDMDDSASMNIWLHAQVIAQLAANGGKVPADLLHK